MVLELGKELRDETVTTPWESVAAYPDQSRQRLPPGKRMGDLFVEVGNSLLILGAPGSGKTISMLELTRDLLDRFDADQGQPVPVYFNLATWAGQRPLARWLIPEFGQRYDVRAKQARAWLGDQRLILLFDGLDEVRPDYRQECVYAINDFVRQAKPAGYAVCCRLDEYVSLSTQLNMRGAVCLQPLSPEQVERYLAQAEAQLGGLRETLRSDDQLRELSSTPLMLSVMALAYQGLPAEAIREEQLDTVDERRTRLFSTYVQRMLELRAGKHPPYPHPRTIRWLTWLARGIQHHSASDFLIERLQPDWLATSAERVCYTVGSRVLGGLAIGLILGLTMNLGLVLTGSPASGFMEEWNDLIPRLLFGLLVGLANGLMAGLVDGARFERSLRRNESRQLRTPREVAADVIVYVLALGLVGWLLVTRVGKLDDAWEGIKFGMLFGVVFGVLFGFHDGRRSPRDDIRTVEAVRWSWREAWSGFRRSGGRGLVVGAGLGVLFALFTGGTGTRVDWQNGVIFTTLGGLIGAAVGGLLGAGKEGLKGTSIPGTALPNQGIALSVRSALLRGLLVGGSFGLTLWLGFLRTAGPSGALNGALVVGLLFGTLAAVGGGLLDVVQHYTLRAVLAARGYAPLNYSRFLDYAARLVLLQRAGGGYLFIHRLLLEHFVAGKASWAGPRAPQVGPGDASAASVPPQIQAPTTTPAPQAASTAQMT